MQYGEDEVRQHLSPYHDRILHVIEQGYAEWVATKRSIIESGAGSVLYPRTVANHVFDAIARRVILEFNSDEDVDVSQNAQTLKLRFKDVVLARFKKGDEYNLGRNHPTQAVMNFISAEGQLPGMPPSAAKVEFLYTANEITDCIERVVVAARNHNELLWHYEITPSIAASTSVTPFPSAFDSPNNAADAAEELVIPRKNRRIQGTSNSNGN